MSEPLQVFVSLIPGEVEGGKKRIKDALGAIPLARPWVFAFTPTSVRVRKSDVFVLVIGQDVSSAMKKEYGLAVMYNKPRLLFLRNVDRAAASQEFALGIGAKWVSFDDTPDLCLKLREAMMGELASNYGRYGFGETDVAELNELSRQLAMVEVRSKLSSARRYTDHAYYPPAVRYQLFGRDSELETTIEALRECQTVLLYGLFGVGKTALAAHAAREVSDRFADGILWLDVGQASLPAVCDAIARTLGVEETLKLAPEVKSGAIRRLLDTNDLLIALDDVGQAATAAGFLRDCLPQDKPLLATSRNHHLGFDTDLYLGPLARGEAVALFYDRAGSIGPRSSVDRVCALLGDHPLALVIATGRVRQERIPIERLVMRLRDERSRLQLLMSEVDKDANVWASLSISYETLGEQERRVFSQLAACFGDRTGLELLSDISGLPEQECEDTLGRLVARSLVEREGHQFSVHRLVRDFGRAVVGDGLVEVHDRIVTSVLSYVRRHEKPEPEHLDKLEEELGNIVGAIDHVYAARHWPSIIVLMDSLSASDLLGLRGHWVEAVSLGEMALEAASHVNDQEARAKFAYYTAGIYQSQGKYAEAKRLYQEVLDIQRGLGNRLASASCLRRLGEFALGSGEHAEARRLYQESLDILREFDAHEETANTLHHLGKLVQGQGEYAEARMLYEESLRLRKELGNQRGIARSLHQLGTLAQAQGDYGEAKILLQQSLGISRALNDPRKIGWTLHQLGTIAFVQGDYGEAGELYEESLRIKQALGHLVGTAWSLLELGTLARTLGDSARAHELYQQSLTVSEGLNHQKCVYRALCQLGILAREQGDYDEADKLCRESLEVAERLKDRWGIAQALLQRGVIARKQRDYAKAHRLCRESLSIFVGLGDQRSIGEASHHLGVIAQDQGDYSDAEELYQRSLTIRKKLGEQRGLATTYVRLAQLKASLGDSEGASQLTDRAGEIFQRIGAVHYYNHIEEQALGLGEEPRAA